MAVPPSVEGDALDGAAEGAPRAVLRPELAGRRSVVAHPCRALASGRRAEQRDRRGDGHPPVAAGGPPPRPTRGIDPVLHLPAALETAPGRRDRQGGGGADLVRRAGGEPSPHRREPPRQQPPRERVPDELAEARRRAGRRRVPDRALRIAAPREPVARRAVERRHRIRLAPREPRPQRVADQAVMAVGVARRRAGGDQHAAPGERRQARPGPGGREHRVARRRGEAVQHCGAGEEVELARRQPIQDLVLEEVLDCGASGDAAEVEPRRPALCALDEGRDLVGVEVGAGGPQHPAGLGVVHREIGRPQAEEKAPRAQQPEPQGGLGTAAQRDLGPGGQAVADHPHRIEPLGRGQEMGVVDDQERRVPDVGHRAADPAEGRRRGHRARILDPAAEVREDGEDVRCQLARVPVLGTQREPRDTPRVGAGPPREQRGLAVPRRGADHDDRGGLAQPPQECGSSDRSRTRRRGRKAARARLGEVGAEGRGPVQPLRRDVDGHAPG